MTDTEFSKVWIEITDSRGGKKMGSVNLHDTQDPEKVAAKVHSMVLKMTATPPDRVATCLFCGLQWSFTPSWLVTDKDIPPQYCAEHRDRRKRTSQCPTPSKRSFDSEENAVRWALTSSGGTGKGFRTYECPCGSFHISSKV